MSKVQNVHLFNCDETYKFDTVEAWLEKERSKQAFSVQRHYFSLPKMFEISNETIPGLNMDLAVFVVHAHESRLSINEENAGIGYAMIYRALLEKTGDNVIIIIGGDDNYRDEDEESKEFISRWAKRKISSQFNDEYMDGRKGLILSWNKEHREIHEEALFHFLDPIKRGTKFEYKPKRKLPPRPKPEKTERTQQSNRGSFSEEDRSVREVPSRAESSKHSSATMTALPNPPQEAGQDNSLGSATRHISRSELRSSSSDAVRNVGVSSHKGASSGLPETQRKSIDLVVLGCHISKESIHITKEVFLSLSSSLDIKSHMAKNCSPIEAKVFLEENVARFCVLLADAETVNDAYTALPARKREYEDLLQTAARRVAEKVIVVIFKPCSFRTTQDEMLVTNSMESTLVASGQGYVLYVEDDSTKIESQRISDIREKIINLLPYLKSQSDSNDSIRKRDFKQSSNVTERTVPNMHKGCRPAQPPQHMTGYGAHQRVAYQSQQSSSTQPRGPQWANQDFSSMEGFVMLRSRLKFGQLTNDLEIHYPGFRVPLSIERGMHQAYGSISEALVEVRSDGKGGYAWSPYNKKSLVQLTKNETVMLKTRLRNGQISLEKGKLEFMYPGWTTPEYLIEDLRKKYYLYSDRELYIISNEKRELRCLVFKEGHLQNLKNFFST